jgi:hypothetical protein
VSTQKPLTAFKSEGLFGHMDGAVSISCDFNDGVIDRNASNETEAALMNLDELEKSIIE